jgi:hypothetical protein
MWKGCPVEDFSEMGVVGSISCQGPVESIDRFIKPITGKKYFDPEVYDNGWQVCDSAVIDAGKEINKVSIMIAFYQKLVPVSALRIKDDYSDCDFEINFDFEGQLSDWWEVRNYKTIPKIAELLKRGVIDGSETISGVLRFGRFYKSRIREELILDLDPMEGDRTVIKQDIHIVKNKLNISNSLFISK